MKRRDVRVGINVKHRPTGEHLGTVVKVLAGGGLVVFNGGKRGRGIASNYEIEPCDPPEPSAVVLR